MRWQLTNARGAAQVEKLPDKSAKLQEWDKASKRAIRLHVRDNTATALEELHAGDIVAAAGGSALVKLVHNIHTGHKFALCDIVEGEVVIKYGVPIGRTTMPVATGEHIHLHNLVSQQGESEGQ
jgi:altronate dehydratase